MPEDGQEEPGRTPRGCNGLPRGPDDAPRDFHNGEKEPKTTPEGPRLSQRDIGAVSSNVSSALWEQPWNTFHDRLQESGGMVVWAMCFC